MFVSLMICVLYNKPYLYIYLQSGRLGRILWTLDLLKVVWYKAAERPIGKKEFFHKWFWHNWKVTCKTINLDPYLIPYSKTNSKYMCDLKNTELSIATNAILSFLPS